jgi:hypothetical protein
MLSIDLFNDQTLKIRFVSSVKICSMGYPIFPQVQTPAFMYCNQNFPEKPPTGFNYKKGKCFWTPTFFVKSI